MANWRPVDVRLWNDRKFLAGSDDARLLWLFLLTCPSLPIPGVVLGGDAALAEMLGWTLERLRERFQELSRNGLRVRRESRIVWLTNALKYQPPANPNMVKCWAGKWDDVPEGSLKSDLWEAIRIACKRWSVLFTKLFAKPLVEPLQEPFEEPSANGSRHKHKHEHKHQHEHYPEENPSPARAIQPTAVPSATEVQTTLEVRQSVRGELLRELNEARQAVAAELGVEHRPLLAHDPGERALAMMLTGPDAARVATDARHAIRVAAAEAVRDRSLKWLTGTVFEERNYRRLVGSTVEEASRQRDGPKRTNSATGRAEPKRPEEYREGDQKL